VPRVSVPDDYDSDHIVVAGTEDYHYPEADVQVDAPRARTLQIRSDEDGRYCGPPAEYADAVRAHLGVTERSENESGADDEAESVSLDDGCPWCDEYDGANVGQHASSAHSDEWAAYKAD